MLKAILCAAVIMGFSINSMGVLSTEWGAQTSGAFLYDSLDSLLDSGVGDYQIQLVVDVNSDTDMSALMGGYVGLTGDANGWDSFTHSTATDDIIHTADMRTWLDGGGGVSYFLNDQSFIDDTYASAAFYFRWFNADSQANASEAGFIYGSGGSGGVSGWTLATGPSDPDPPVVALDYADIGAVGSSYTAGPNDGWQTIQPIPEPGTIGLFIIGAGVLAYRKRRQVQQAIQA